jgi:hypothetical protein
MILDLPLHIEKALTDFLKSTMCRKCEQEEESYHIPRECLALVGSLILVRVRCYKDLNPVALAGLSQGPHPVTMDPAMVCVLWVTGNCPLPTSIQNTTIGSISSKSIYCYKIKYMYARHYFM